ncbi:MAG: UDP-N-acetylglucosamine 2-epimerase (non-hydrolyzing) [Saprospiraceae bacterium]|nr:UDP-N-acetylglucosamine 2-epimerase (non-hydrolyzing) [Saprospiraceae bacterium]
MTIALIVGARPNFIKAAPLWKALQQFPELKVYLIHTGQHQDAVMSSVFLDGLGLPAPHFCLPERRSGVVQKIAQIIFGLETIFQKIRPDWVFVIGDVTSTLAGALAAKQQGIRVAHVEAGLRSGDLEMPEERNRIQVDHLSDLLFASETSGVFNLEREGIPSERIFFPGNVLIDALHAVLPEAKMLNPHTVIQTALFNNPGQLLPKNWALATFHRPSNVDQLAGLQKTIQLLQAAARWLPVLFPVHPRTMKSLKRHMLDQHLQGTPNLYLLRPLGYAEMICLTRTAKFVLTDSGGVQEESTCLNVPCLTFRSSTERPATVETGTNMLISDLEIQTAEAQIEVLLAGRYKSGAIPPLWDGQAAPRIVQHLIQVSQHQTGSAYTFAPAWKK